ncbi:MAG: Arc family DNA-binding protein [Pseudomonadota bacterium]
MSEGKPGRGSDQFALRLPDGMRERIKRAADVNGRSMNAEIVATLEVKYPSPLTFTREEFLAHIQKLELDAGDDPKKQAKLEQLVVGFMDQLASAFELSDSEERAGLPKE